MKYNDKDVFRVPEDYFENFSRDMMLKVKQRQDKGARKYYSFIKPHLMLAASMVLIVIVSYTLLRMMLPDFVNKDETDDTSELVDYLAYEMDQSALLESFELAEMESSSEYIIGESLSTDEIVDYLLRIEFDLINLDNQKIY